MRINHNLASLNTYRSLSANNSASSKSLEKLSSGLRINKAGDDAAGLAISEKMRAQIRGLDQASRNAQDAISLVQTAEGALSETHSILQRMNELAVQSATDTNTAADRTKLQSEMDQLAKEITRISNTTEFNTQNLLAGGLNNIFHVGGNANQNINLNISAMDAESLGVAGDLVTTTFTGTNTHVSATTNVSNGLNGYKVATLAKVDATNGSVTASNSNGGTGTVNGTFNASQDKSFVVKIGSVDGSGKVLTASYSTDGGASFNNAAVNSYGTDSIATLSDGLSMTVVTDTDNAANNTYSFVSTAEYKNLQLQTSAGSAVGGTVKIYNNMSGATIGNASTGQTADVAFTYSTLDGTVGGGTVVTFTGTNTGATSISNVSAGVNGYMVATLSKIDSDRGNSSIKSGTGGSGIPFGTYTGAVDKTFIVRIDTTQGSGANKNVATASYSIDGGGTWNAPSSVIGYTGFTDIYLSSGIGITIHDDANNTASDTYTFDAHAEYKNIVLRDNSFSIVGSIVKVYNDGSSSKTIGTGGKTVDVAYTYAALSSGAKTDIISQVVSPAGANDTINQTSVASTVATIGAGGAVTTAAITQKGIDISTQVTANLAITTVNSAITTVSTQRSALGAMQNRLEHTINNLGTASENLTSAESRVRDVDMAKVMMEFTKNNILMQTSQAMLAQANQQPQGVLQLLR